MGKGVIILIALIVLIGVILSFILFVKDESNSVSKSDIKIEDLKDKKPENVIFNENLKKMAISYKFENKSCVIYQNEVVGCYDRINRLYFNNYSDLVFQAFNLNDNLSFKESFIYIEGKSIKFEGPSSLWSEVVKNPLNNERFFIADAEIDGVGGRFLFSTVNAPIPLGQIDWVGNQLFSLKRHIVYTKREGGYPQPSKNWIVVDDKTYGPFEQVQGLTFNDEGNKALFYTSDLKENQTKITILDLESGISATDTIQGFIILGQNGVTRLLRFLPNSDDFAYAVESSTDIHKNKWVIGKKSEPEYKGVGNIMYSKNGKSYAYLSSADIIPTGVPNPDNFDEAFTINGKKEKKYYAVSSFVFNEDGTQYAYFAHNGSNSFLVKNGKEIISWPSESLIYIIGFTKDNVLISTTVKEGSMYLIYDDRLSDFKIGPGGALVAGNHVIYTTTEGSQGIGELHLWDNNNKIDSFSTTYEHQFPIIKLYFDEQESVLRYAVKTENEEVIIKTKNLD